MALAAGLWRSTQGGGRTFFGATSPQRSSYGLVAVPAARRSDHPVQHTCHDLPLIAHSSGGSGCRDGAAVGARRPSRSSNTAKKYAALFFVATPYLSVPTALRMLPVRSLTIARAA